MERFDPSRIFVDLGFESLREERAQEILSLIVEYELSAKLDHGVTGGDGWTWAFSEVNRHGNVDIFVDSKSGNTDSAVEREVRRYFEPWPKMVNIHADSPIESLKRFMEIRNKVQPEDDGRERSLAIGVTVLTTEHPHETIIERGKNRPATVQRLARKVLDLGFDGVTCAYSDLPFLGPKSPDTAIRKKRIKTVILGVRPDWAPTDNQIYPCTPAQAVEADFMSIGRPIYDPPADIGSPRNAIEAILEEAETAWELLQTKA
jgi:orotidine-5'-phosphate decarboxylase